jgi:hypothetical protein
VARYGSARGVATMLTPAQRLAGAM